MDAPRKKQIPLRLSEKLYEELTRWAEDDFRSVNGQIEYLLTECVKQRRKNGAYVGKEIDAPLGVVLGDTRNRTDDCSTDMD
ncbi:MAG: PTS ascorbate transporter subunit IIC [Clostridia bacterium]|nr:PTS ascorbate transporter subunit IIC [Clostridia bacterium]